VVSQRACSSDEQEHWASINGLSRLLLQLQLRRASLHAARLTPISDSDAGPRDGLGYIYRDTEI
jgi:hypothetical protein